MLVKQMRFAPLTDLAAECIGKALSTATDLVFRPFSRMGSGGDFEC